MTDLTPGPAPSNFAIRQPPAPGIAVRRAAVAFGVGALILILFVAAWFGLQRPNRQQERAANDEAPQLPVAPVPALPNDVYPLNAPPEPGVKPNAPGVPERGRPAQGRVISPEELELQRRLAEEAKKDAERLKQLAAEEEAARKSTILFPGQLGQGNQSAGGRAGGNTQGAVADAQAALNDTLAKLQQTTQAMAQPGLSFGAGATTPDQLAQAGQVGQSFGSPDPTGQAAGGSLTGGGQNPKEAFLRNSTKIGNTRVNAQYQRASSPYTLTAGTTIPAGTMTRLNSDLPGDVFAWVTQDVYDSVTGNYVLIPQGTKIIGRYDNSVSHGQDRALVVWSRLVFPNADSIELEGMPGADESGTAGVSDDVNEHFWRKAKAVLLSSVLTYGGNLVANSDKSTDTTSGQQSLGQSIAQNANQTGQQIVKKDMDIAPTIEVRQGWPIRVMVNKDLVLQPYRK